MTSRRDDSPLSTAGYIEARIRARTPGQKLRAATRHIAYLQARVDALRQGLAETLAHADALALALELRQATASPWNPQGLPIGSQPAVEQ